MPKKKLEVAEDSELLTYEDLVSQRAAVEKKLGYKFKWGNDESLELTNLSFGIPTVDAALNGGLVFGRTILFYGESTSGKTTMAYLAMKAAQDAGLAVGLIDVENAFDPAWANALGLDISRIVYPDPPNRSAEEYIHAARTMIDAKFGVVVLDSLAALASQAELDADPDKKFIAEQAKIVGEGIKVLNNINRKTVFIVINQTRLKAGPSAAYGNPEVMPGGKAAPFYASQTVKIKKGEYLTESGKKDDKRIGHVIHITVEKDKHGTPFKEADFSFFYTGEIDEVASMVSEGLSLGIITQAGPYFSLGSFKVLGRVGLQDAIKSDPELRKLLEDTIEGIPDAGI